MRKIFAASALVLALLTGACAEVDSGVIKEKLREAGRTELDCDKKTSGSGKSKKTTTVCDWETTPDKCMFRLDNGKEKGWLEVRCADEYDSYQVGENYPR